MLFLALRQLLSRKRQSFLTLAGVTLGTAAFVVISGMMLGFQEFIIDQLVNNDSHIRISAREERITERSLDRTFFEENEWVSWITPPSGRRDSAYLLHPRAWFDRLDADPEVAAYSEQFVTDVIASRGKIRAPARLAGARPEKQRLVSNIENYMLEGSFTDIGTGGSRIVAGQGLLERLGARTGDTIHLALGSGAAQPFRIVGSFQLGVKTLDDLMIFGALSEAQQLAGTPNRITDVAIRLHDVSAAGAKASTWDHLSDDKVQSWDQANEGIMSVFKTQDIVRISMTVSILVVAGFGIYNVLSSAVLYRRREIAILRSMGYLPWDIVVLFLIQGILLGLIGGIVGDMIGYFGSKILATIEVSSARGLGAGRMIISFNPWIYVRGFFLAFGSATLASYLPARAAGRLSPMDIIRGENS